MASSRITDSALTVNVTTGGSERLALADQTAELMDLLEALKATTDVTRFHFWPLTATTSRYRFDVTDGRVWNQVITFGDPVVMTFNQVQGEWSLDEFVQHRPLRDFVIARRRLDGWTEIDAVWS